MRMRGMILWAVTMLGVVAMPVQAQVTTIDPNRGIDSDINAQPAQSTTPPPPSEAPRQDSVPVDNAAAPSQGMPMTPSARRQAVNTFQRDDLIAGAEGVFGKGAAGLSRLIENILRDQGEPNAYIAGREAAGAIVVGLRYGSGNLFHKVEGERPVYWTGPSVGFDLGGDASKVFVLVYNLYDSQDLYKRFPQGEGRIFVVGGFSASYLRRGDVVLIPVRLGVGWRLGVNAGYMKFSEKKRWLPF